MRISLHFVLLFFIGACIKGNTQNSYIPNLELEWVTSDIRANFGTVTDLYEDSLGVIWMGVFGKGMAYYDGRKTQRLRLPEEASFANQTQIFYPYRNFIYLNCGRKILVFDPIRKEVIDEIEFESASEQKISDLCIINQDGKAKIIAVVETNNSLEQTLYQLYESINHNALSLIRSEVLSTQGEATIQRLSDKEIILKGPTSLLRYNVDSGQSSKITENNLLVKAINKRNTILQGDSIIWTNVYNHNNIENTKRYLTKINLQKEGKRFSESIKEYRNILITEFGILDNKVFGERKAYDLSELKAKPFGGSYFSPRVLKGKSGTLFFGGVYGLVKYRYKNPVFKKIDRIGGRQLNELPDRRIVGTVDLYPKAPATMIYDPANDSTYISKIFRANNHDPYQAPLEDGFIYLPTGKVNIQNGDFTLMPDVMEDFIAPPMLSLLDQAGRIWKANWKEDQVAIYNKKTGERIRKTRVEALTKKPVEINDWFQRPSDGSVWMGTYGQGIFIFSSNGELLNHLNREVGSIVNLVSNHVCGFYEDPKRNMWITHSAGISKISPDLSNIEHFSPDPSDPEARIFYSILPDDNDQYLWLSSSRGIFRFDVHTATFINFPLDEAIMEFEFNRTSYLKAKNGRFFFGTSDPKDPTIAFYPQEVLNKYERINSTEASIHLSQLKTFYESGKSTLNSSIAANQSREITFDNDVKSFELEFTLTDLRKPDKIYYGYQLDGYEKTWSDFQRDNNSLSYGNLKHGKYTLNLAAGMSPNLNKATKTSINIEILPLWYQTWWAKALFFLIGLSLIAALYHYNLKRQEERLEKKRLKELDTVKNRLYTNITHEFRTPLTVILGMNENIEGHETEKSLIRRNAQGLLSLINQILDLSKLKSGGLQLKLVKEDLVPLVKDSVASFFSLASAKRIKLTFESAHGKIIASYDRSKMQHIIYNLVSNAVKFTKSGGKINVQIKVENGRLIIRVKDTGIGIEAEEMGKIFDRYFQVNSPNIDAGKIEGTGIGLAYTKELVDLLGGSIDVTSKLNWGSEFTVVLPLQQIANSLAPIKIENHDVSASSTIKVLAKPIKSSDKEHILLIEDNEGVAEYVKSILDKNYLVDWTINGKFGIEQAISQIPDLIVTDIMMPEKDGFEVAQALKNDERTSHIPLIMLTAKADFDSRLEGLSLGAEAYLSKPFEKEELIVRIEKLLALRKQLQAYYSSSTKEKPAVEGPPSKEQAFVKKISTYVEENLTKSDLSVHDFARALNMSQVQVYRKLKAITGFTPVLFIRKKRMEAANKLLMTTDMNISEIAYEVGFNDPNYFSRVFKKEFGKAPGGVRAKG